jgi:hypothetical protein
MGLIITEAEIKDKMHDFYQSGGGDTFYVGFNALAKHYSIKEGGVTDWTGLPGSGKTELLLEMLVNCSSWYDHKHLIYMPDAGTVEEVMAKLIHKFTGKQLEEFYYDGKGEKVEIKNRIKEGDLFKHIPEVLKYFRIYNPEGKNNKKGNRSKAVSPNEFWEYAVENKKKLGIFSAVIDSWNYMRHDTTGFDREDKWLEETLSYRNELAERNGLHLHTIIHPRTSQKDKTGKVLMPDMHSLKGGSEWANNGKTIIICHRKFGSPITDIKIDKAKPRIVGVQGMACLKYDPRGGRFYENIKDHKLKRFYAHKEPLISEEELSGVEDDFSHLEDGPTNDELF